MLQNGISHRCACVKPSPRGGGVAPFWGSATLPEKALREQRDMGYRSDSAVVSREMGPLRSLFDSGYPLDIFSNTSVDFLREKSCASRMQCFQKGEGQNLHGRVGRTPKGSYSTKRGVSAF